jgi:hypothetical protein
MAVKGAPSVRDFAHGAGQFCLNGGLAVYIGASLELENASFHAQQLHVQNQLIAWFHRLLETGIVNAGKVIHHVIGG